jgi:MFS family permease
VSLVADQPPRTAAVPASLARAPQAPEPPTLTNRRGMTLLGGFTAAHFSHHISNSLLNPLLPYIRDALTISYAQSGLLVSAFAVSLGFSNAPLGWLADRFGPRPVIVFGLILTGLISALLALSQDYTQLFLALVVMGVIAGSYHAPASTLLSRAFPATVRGTAIGLHITGGHLSFFLVPVTAAWLVSLTGTWRTPYLWLAFAPIVMGLLIWRLAPAEHQSPARGRSPFAVFGELWGVIRLVGPFISVSILFQMAYAALNAFMALYLVDARGLSKEWAAILFGVPQLVGVLGAPLAGNLSDRIGRRTVILIGMAGLGPSFLILTATPEPLLLLPLLAIGLAAALRQTSTEVLVMDSAPPERRATLLGGYYMLSQELGGFAAPALGIWASVAGVGPAFVGTCFGLAVCSGLVLLARRRL